VLLVFGGNWCYDCHVPIRALREAPRESLWLRVFFCVHVDIGEGDKNLDLVRKYQTTLDKGRAAVVILHIDRRVLYSSMRVEFEAARRMMKKDLVAFLCNGREAS